MKFAIASIKKGFVDVRNSSPYFLKIMKELRITKASATSWVRFGHWALDHQSNKEDYLVSSEPLIFPGLSNIDWEGFFLLLIIMLLVILIS